MEERHARTRARPARRGVDLSRTPPEGVRRHAGGVRELVDEDHLHARLAEAWHVDPELSVDRLPDRDAARGHSLREPPPQGEPEVPSLDDGERVADAARAVEGHFPPALALDDLPGQGDEGRCPPERDLAAAILVPPRDRLHDARLGVDDDRSLRALARHHAGLDGHGRRADRALAAGNVITPGIDEEEPEVRVGRDRLGHHRDQEAAVPARLEAEARAEMVQMLLEPAALVANRAPWQRPEAARQEPYPDPRRVKVDRLEDAIGPHSATSGCRP